MIDVKSYGISDSCAEFAPASEDLVLAQILLPPTLGLAKNMINPGEDAIVRGYSMPDAEIVIIQKDTGTKTLNADISGYFGTIYKDLKQGTYYFSASATYKGIKSLTQKYELKLEVGEDTKVPLTQITEEEKSSFLTWIIAGLLGMFALLGIIVFILPRTAYGKLLILKFKKSKVFAALYPILSKYRFIKSPAKPSSAPQIKSAQNKPAKPQIPPDKG
jgi:hypothetical protein